MTVREYLVQNFRLADTRIRIIGSGKAQDAAESSGALTGLQFATSEIAPALRGKLSIFVPGGKFNGERKY